MHYTSFFEVLSEHGQGLIEGWEAPYMNILRLQSNYCCTSVWIACADPSRHRHARSPPTIFVYQGANLDRGWNSTRRLKNKIVLAILYIIGSAPGGPRGCSGQQVEICRFLHQIVPHYMLDM